MIESKEQIEYSEVILGTMSKLGGQMERSELEGMLQEKYNYAREPEIQLEQLMLTDELLVQKGAWLFLTKEGKKAAKLGFCKYQKRLDADIRVSRLKERLSLANAFNTLLGAVIGSLLTGLAWWLSLK